MTKKRLLFWEKLLNYLSKWYIVPSIVSWQLLKIVCSYFDFRILVIGRTCLLGVNCSEAEHYLPPRKNR